MEKILKAYLLLEDPSRDVKKLNHGLPALLSEVDKLLPSLALDRFQPVAQKFKGHYQTRYPDNTDASTSMTTADVHELDEVMIFLNEHLPCPRNVKYRTGMYALITSSLDDGRTATPEEYWLKYENRYLLPIWSRVVADYYAVNVEQAAL